MHACVICSFIHFIFLLFFTFPPFYSPFPRINQASSSATDDPSSSSSSSEWTKCILRRPLRRHARNDSWVGTLTSLRINRPSCLVDWSHNHGFPLIPMHEIGGGYALLECQYSKSSELSTSLLIHECSESFQEETLSLLAWWGKGTTMSCWEKSEEREEHGERV